MSRNGEPVADTIIDISDIIYKYGNGRLALKPDDASYADYLYWFHFSNASLQPAIMRYVLPSSLHPTFPSDRLFDREGQWHTRDYTDHFLLIWHEEEC